MRKKIRISKLGTTMRGTLRNNIYLGPPGAQERVWVPER